MLLICCFSSFLSCEVEFTVQVEEFIAYDGVKISYTKNPLGEASCFRSHPILFEKGIVNQRDSCEVMERSKDF